MKVLFAILTIFLSNCCCLERDLTIIVDPGKSDCFFQQINAGQIIDIEYQVIDGGQGGLDIGFLVVGPAGRVLAAPGRRQSGSHRAPAPSTGEYQFCFDNSHSKFNAKTIYFDIMVDSDDEDDDNEDDDNSDKSQNNDSKQLADSHDRLNELVSRLKHNLSGARRLQESISVTATRDLHYAERSLWRVSVCSLTHTFAMLFVGVLQVIMVRSLFDEKSRVHGLLKKIPIGKS